MEEGMNMDVEMLKRQLRKQLYGGEAHIPLDRAFMDIPFSKLGVKPANLDHTLWTLAYHIRICQDDMIAYVENDNYRELPFPSGYWPQSHKPTAQDAWEENLSAIDRGLKTMEGWIEKPLFQPLEANENHSLYRQITIIAHHNSYHLAQIVDLRQLLEIPVKDW